jgi:hypothetical protein
MSRHTVAARIVHFLNYRPNVADPSNAPVDIIRCRWGMGTSECMALPE